MKGWHNESYRHALASRGIGTGMSNNKILNGYSFENRINYLDNTRDLLERSVIMKSKNGNMVGHGTLIIDHRNKNIEIGGIRIYEKHRGKGLSKLLMTELVKIIDDIGYEAQLMIIPDDDSPLTEGDLEKICKSSGFEIINYETLEMRRLPRSRFE